MVRGTVSSCSLCCANWFPQALDALHCRTGVSAWYCLQTFGILHQNVFCRIV